MIVQTIFPGTTGGDVRANDLIILIPGGGVGPGGGACTKQYGNSYRWYVDILTCKGGFISVIGDDLRPAGIMLPSPLAAIG
jgi:hypothetical protein